MTIVKGAAEKSAKFESDYFERSGGSQHTFVHYLLFSVHQEGTWFDHTA